MYSNSYVWSEDQLQHPSIIGIVLYDELWII